MRFSGGEKVRKGGRACGCCGLVRERERGRGGGSVGSALWASNSGHCRKECMTVHKIERSKLGCSLQMCVGILT